MRPTVPRWDKLLVHECLDSDRVFAKDRNLALQQFVNFAHYNGTEPTQLASLTSFRLFNLLFNLIPVKDIFSSRLDLYIAQLPCQPVL